VCVFVEGAQLHVDNRLGTRGGVCVCVELPRLHEAHRLATRGYVFVEDPQLQAAHRLATKDVCVCVSVCPCVGGGCLVAC